MAESSSGYAAEAPAVASDQKAAIPGMGEVAFAILMAGEPDEPPRISGPLLKQASNWVSGFQARHFEVNAGVLRYWHTTKDAESGKEPAHELPLLGLRLEVDQNSDTQFKLIFATKERAPFVVSTEAPSEVHGEQLSRDDWMDALKQNAYYAKRRLAFKRASSMMLPKDMADFAVPVDYVGQEPDAFDSEEEASPVQGEKRRPTVQFKDTSSFITVQEYDVPVSSTSGYTDESEQLPAEEEPSPQLEAAIVVLAEGPPAEPARLSGPLLKQGKTGMFGALAGLQNRHFSVCDGKLCYWYTASAQESEQPPCAEYSLAGASFSKSAADESMFDVTFREEKSFTLKADVGDATSGAHDREEWIAALKAHELFAKKKVVYKWAERVGDC